MKFYTMLELFKFLATFEHDTPVAGPGSCLEVSIDLSCGKPYLSFCECVDEDSDE